MRTHILILVLICGLLTACNTQTKRVGQAQSLYKEGLHLREQRQSEEAAEKFLQGLEALQSCEETTEALNLESQLCDTLGAIYFKKGMTEGASAQPYMAL